MLFPKIKTFLQLWFITVLLGSCLALRSQIGMGNWHLRIFFELWDFVARRILDVLNTAPTFIWKNEAQWCWMAWLMSWILQSRKKKVCPDLLTRFVFDLDNRVTELSRTEYHSNWTNISCIFHIPAAGKLPPLGKENIGCSKEVAHPLLGSGVFSQAWITCKPVCRLISFSPFLLGRDQPAWSAWWEYFWGWKIRCQLSPNVMHYLIH